MESQITWKKIAMYGGIGLCIVSAYRLLTRDPDNAFPLVITVGQMPACDSSTARRLLRRTLEQSARGQQLGLTVHKLGDFGDFSPATAAQNVDRRGCIADVFTNAGRNPVGFTLQWMSGQKDELWLEVPYVPF